MKLDVYWVISVSSAYFAIVTSSGGAYGDSASCVSGVRPVFCIGI